VNTQKPNPERLKTYEKYGQKFVVPDIDVIRSMGYNPVAGNYISDLEVVRHDPVKLACAMFRIINKSKILNTFR
jgi:hypothetical protein